MPSDPVLEALLSIRFIWAGEDPDALTEIERRIASTAQLERTITYTKLVDGILFHLPSVHGGQPFLIIEWTDLHRRIIGDFLGQVNMRSYSDHGFLASSLVVDKAEGRPSPVFFRDLKAVLPPGCSVDGFWVEQVKKAYAFHAVKNT